MATHVQKGLIDHIFEEWEKTPATMEYDEGAAVVGARKFADFANKWMQANQPAGLDYLSVGLGLRMQDGTVIPYVQQDETVTEIGGIGGEVQISKPSEEKLHKGIEPSPSFGITGDEGK